MCCMKEGRMGDAQSIIEITGGPRHGWNSAVSFYMILSMEKVDGCKGGCIFSTSGERGDGVIPSITELTAPWSCSIPASLRIEL